MNNLLYFPYISVPSTRWMTQTLLYWDKVASIIPADIMNTPNQLDDFTQKLLQEELLEAIIPDNYIYDIRDFTDNFMIYVESNLHKFYRNSNKTARVHSGKMMSSLANKLCDMGLAEYDHNWINMPHTLAQDFMTYLAFLLGQTTDYKPMTDRIAGFSSINSNNYNTGNSIGNSIKNINRNKMRMRILDNILPVPENICEITPYDLVMFKNRYSNELHIFRNTIEEFILSLENCTEQQADERCKIFVENKQAEIKNIEAILKSKWKKICFSSLCAASGPVVNLITENKMALISGGIGLIYSIYSTFKSNNINPCDKPMAYAAYTQRQFTIAKK